MMVMIFVNDLDSVKGLPWWTYHRGKINGLTYVDMVFPAFLFLVGMSLPIAVRARLKRDPSETHLWLHIILRSLSLVILGVILANADEGNPALMGISQPAWALAALIGAVLFWNVYPPSSRHQTRFRVLKYTGVALLVAMFAIFRRTADTGHVAWINTSYWEILGIIGWTYLAVAIVYIPTRRFQWAPLLWFTVFLLMSIAAAAKMLSFHLPAYLWPFDNGSHPMIVMGGVVTSTIFLARGETISLSKRMASAFLFAIVTLTLAIVLTPLGISKIYATPTWCLYSVSSSVLIFMLLYWICDVKRKTGWAFFVKSAGANTLTTYLVPDLYYFASAAAGVELFGHFTHGWQGVTRAVLFTFLMLGLAALLTKLRVRMQL